MEASYGVELYMMTSSNGIIFRVTARCAGNSSVTGEIPLTKASDAKLDVFYDQRLNTRLSKQSWGWWFETLSRSLRRYCNEPLVFKEYWKAQNPKPSPFLHNRNSSFCVQSGHMMTLEFISSYHSEISKYTSRCNILRNVNFLSIILECVWCVWMGFTTVSLPYYYVNVISIIAISSVLLLSIFIDKYYDVFQIRSWLSTSIVRIDSTRLVYITWYIHFSRYTIYNRSYYIDFLFRHFWQSIYL